MKLFGKYDYNVQVSDPGLVEYINLKEVYVPHSHGRYEGKVFWKNKASLVERFMKHLMSPGHKGKKHYWSSQQMTGKYHLAFKIIQNTFVILEEKTKENPIQTLIKAIEFGSPRSEVVSIGLGGRKVLKPVDTSPMRRVDLAMRWITQTARLRSLKKKISIEQSLANEIIAAANNDTNSGAVSKKQEQERQAKAAR